MLSSYRFRVFELAIKIQTWADTGSDYSPLSVIGLQDLWPMVIYVSYIPVANGHGDQTVYIL